jgi:lysophospholipase L1-like esterase
LSQDIRPQAATALPEPRAQSEADAASVVKAQHSVAVSPVDIEPTRARGLARLLHTFVAPAQQMRRTQLDLLPVTPGGVLFLGDSITEAGMWHEWFPELVAVNRGVGGETVAQVHARLDQVINDPAAISLLVGTNDFSGFGPSRKVEDVAEQLRALIIDIRDRCPGVPLLVTSVLPRDRWFSRRVVQLNARLTRIAADSGAVYVDVWGALANDRGELDARFTKDHIHLSGEGYQVWVDALRPHLRGVGDSAGKAHDA